MRAREFLIEKIIKPQQPQLDNNDADDPLYSLKLAIANKIRILPADPKTEKALHEIEDLLSHVDAGGKKGHIDKELEAIHDKDVQRARSLLAKYVLSLDMTPGQRADLFTQWKNDELINREILLSPGKHLITDVVNGYNGKNPAIKELTDDLSQVAALGQGKGEFLLSVLSKGITKLHKGDLEIDQKRIEVKTLDVGGGRFFDQEVRPSSKFAASVDKFRSNWKNEISSTFAKIAGTGLKLVDLITLSDSIDPTRKSKYFKDVEVVLSNIFPGMDVSGIVSALRVGNIGAAKQQYALTNLNYYIGIKKDDGMLFIDLKTNPISLVFFTNNDELVQGGMRLHAATVYPITNDPRNAYPQMRILPTKQAAGSGEVPTAKAPVQKVKSSKNVPAKNTAAPIKTKVAPAPVQSQQQPVAPTVPTEPPEEELPTK
jgi:hypothetical protein